MKIERNVYLDRLIARKHNGFVKIITGMRRCGKSYLLFNLYREHLLATGVKPSQIIAIALDDDANKDLRNSIRLGEWIRRLIKGRGMHYVFIDEIQMAQKVLPDGVDLVRIAPEDRESAYVTFYDVLNGLMKLPNVDVYVTGSNSKMLSSDEAADANGTLLCYDVRSIGSQAFYGCSSLASINFPEPLWNSAGNCWFEETGLWSIGSQAFENCTGLTVADIPGWVYDIGDRAFGNCYGLRDFVLPKRVFDRGPWEVFSNDDGYYQIALGYRCEWENITVGEGVTSIGDRTFGGLEQLKCVTLPGSVTNIGSRAFANCCRLENVLFEGNAPKVVGDSAFSGVGQSCTAWVNTWSSGWGVLIPGKWNGIKILYLRWSPYPAEAPHVQCAENIIAAQTENGWVITSGYGSVLTDEDLASVKIMAMLGDGTMVDTTRGYDIVLSSDGKSATLKLKPPEFDFLMAEKSTAAKLSSANLMTADVRPEKDPDDPIGLLVNADENDLATKPVAKSGERVGALPVRAVPGLWYQASRGDGLQNMTQGDKVQATGDSLYLGVIKQTGASGFYRLLVSEK